jgi:hypothetical protein
MRSSLLAALSPCRRKELIMRIERRRQKDLFEAAPPRREVPPARREALIELMQALLSEAALAPETMVEGDHEPD